MFAVYLHHYGYTATQVLDEYAKTFFALCAQMYRVQATKNLELLAVTNSAFNGGKEADKLVSQLKKQASGTDKLLNEAKTLREARGL